MPLVAIETADPAATIATVVSALKGAKEGPILEHDIIRGLVGLNKAGETVSRKVSEDPAGSTNPAEMLDKLNRCAVEGTMVFMHNVPRLFDPGVIQAVWNLRDTLKSMQGMLIMMGPAFDMPAELKNDVVMIEEPVPGPEEIRAVVEKMGKDAGVGIPEETLDKATDTLLGYLSMFGIEQSSAMSLTKAGLDINMLWDLKVKTLKNVSGLEIQMPGTGFEALAGCRGAKEFISAYLKGKEPPRAVVMWDEIEKMVAAGTSDLSGTTQAMLEQFLYWTETKKIRGILLVGVPGAGKTATCKATAGEAKVPLLRASMSTVKGSLVGQSEQNMRSLLKSIDAVGQGRVLMIATCNSIEALSPELMARFKLAQFVYDYPDNDEAKSLWSYYMDKYGLSGEIPGGTELWVGREVESCCERAWLFNQSVVEAAKTIVPISVANKDKMDKLRKNLSGRFLSAAHPGVYTYTAPTSSAPARKVTFNA